MTEEDEVASLGVCARTHRAARVLFDRIHGISVNLRTRIRDWDRARVAADFKRTMREKAKDNLKTFAFTADITEAHRQVPIDEGEWHPLGCQNVSCVFAFFCGGCTLFYWHVVGALLNFFCPLFVAIVSCVFASSVALCGPRVEMLFCVFCGLFCLLLPFISPCFKFAVVLLFSSCCCLCFALSLPFYI